MDETPTWGSTKPTGLASFYSCNQSLNLCPCSLLCHGRSLHLPFTGASSVWFVPLCTSQNVLPILEAAGKFCFTLWRRKCLCIASALLLFIINENSFRGPLNWTGPFHLNELIWFRFWVSVKAGILNHNASSDYLHQRCHPGRHSSSIIPLHTWQLLLWRSLGEMAPAQES